jgi:hypothetical protein
MLFMSATHKLCLEHEHRHIMLNQSVYFLAEVTEKFIELSFEFTNIMRVWIFHKLVVFIADPRDIEVT